MWVNELVKRKLAMTDKWISLHIAKSYLKKVKKNTINFVSYIKLDMGLKITTITEKSSEENRNLWHIYSNFFRETIGKHWTSNSSKWSKKPQCQIKTTITAHKWTVNHNQLYKNTRKFPFNGWVWSKASIFSKLLMNGRRCGLSRTGEGVKILATLTLRFTRRGLFKSCLSELG